MGRCFHVTRQQAENKRRGALSVLLNCMCFSHSLFFFHSLHISVTLITFCFTQEAVSSAQSLSLSKQFVFCLVKEWVSVKHPFFFFVCGFDLNLKSWRSCFCAVHIIDNLLCNLLLIHILA